MGGFGGRLMSALLKFDHLLAEGKSLSAIHDEQLHPEDFRVKVNGDVDVSDSEDEVVERIHGYGHINRMILAPGRPGKSKRQRVGAGAYRRLSLGRALSSLFLPRSIHGRLAPNVFFPDEKSFFLGFVGFL
jgi:hypothetical protein